ncbi:MAG: putative esterase [Saprospiraceae bacterium]|jgi:predicted esterase
MQKTIDLQLTASYQTYGTFSDKTETIIIAFHGYGQLAKYFIRKFDILEEAKYYVIAPQGLSKFYLKNHTRVGASWMTKENRALDLKNQLHYVQTVFETETKNIDWSNKKLIILGFSQGTATASRWVSKHQIPFDKFIAWGGQIAYELTTENFDFMKSESKTIALLGDQDEFYNGENIIKMETAFKTVFPKGEFSMYEGKHEILKETLRVSIDS